MLLCLQFLKNYLFPQQLFSSTPRTECITKMPSANHAQHFRSLCPSTKNALHRPNHVYAVNAIWQTKRQIQDECHQQIIFVLIPRKHKLNRNPQTKYKDTSTHFHSRQIDTSFLRTRALWRVILLSGFIQPKLTPYTVCMRLSSRCGRSMCIRVCGVVSFLFALLRCSYPFCHTREQSGAHAILSSRFKGIPCATVEWKNLF